MTRALFSNYTQTNKTNEQQYVEEFKIFSFCNAIYWLATFNTKHEILILSKIYAYKGDPQISQFTKRPLCSFQAIW